MVIPSSILCEHTISLRHTLSSDLREMCLRLLVEYINSYSPKKLQASCLSYALPVACHSDLPNTALPMLPLIAPVRWKMPSLLRPSRRGRRGTHCLVASDEVCKWHYQLQGPCPRYTCSSKLHSSLKSLLPSMDMLLLAVVSVVAFHFPQFHLSCVSLLFLITFFD